MKYVVDKHSQQPVSYTHLAAQSDRYSQERIKAKISGAGTTTASLIQNIAESFTNAAVNIVENFPAYTITIRFTGTSGIPGNMAVSYTHLDVYKRQALCWGVCNTNGGCTGIIWLG